MPSGIARISNDARAARMRFYVLHSVERCTSVNTCIDTCTCHRSDIRSDIRSEIRSDICSDIRKDATPCRPDRGKAARRHGCGLRH